jgi:hypothetical protein
MKLRLEIDTGPKDDPPHYTRVDAALREYLAQVNSNNQAPFQATSGLGMDRGPNTFTASNGVVILERVWD